eukprot:7140162-Ditylum_brightwellii.AAC.1
MVLAVTSQTTSSEICYKTNGAIANLLFKAGLFLSIFFEYEIFIAPPLRGKDLKDIKDIHGGFLYKWASTLQYVIQRTHIDTGYATMRLSGYMAAPNKPIFDALHQCMAYLYHHPHKPIMYPKKPPNNLQPRMELHHGTIKAITADHITPTHRHHDVKIPTIIYHTQKGTITVKHFKSELIG